MSAIRRRDVRRMFERIARADSNLAMAAALGERIWHEIGNGGGSHSEFNAQVLSPLREARVHANKAAWSLASAPLVAGERGGDQT